MGLPIRRSRPVYRKSQFLQDCQYASGDQFIVSPTLFSTIDTLVETSVSLVLLPILLLIHHSRALCCQSTIWQCYRWTGQDQCVVSGSEMQEFFHIRKFLGTISSPGTLFLVFGVGTRNSFNSKKVLNQLQKDFTK